MRTATLITLALAAGLAAVPSRVSAQSKDELPCVGYATFEKKGATTELIGLAIGDIPAVSKVTMSCSGNGCPFITKSFNMKNDVKTLALTDMFSDPNLKPGMIIELRVTKPGWIGKSFQYEIRSADEPKSTTQCVSEDGSKTMACLKSTGKAQR
ncbi:MAG TPA: hypothetical protein VD758_06615 [Gemmatimonadaceae bacterium]|nr:hypothetical protein [Gemmatimonadaceae bacterium]